MYVRTGDALKPVSTLYLYDLSINGVGETLRKSVLLTHYHVRKALDPGAGLLSDPDASVMTRSRMKPEFVPPADPRRQTCRRI